MRRGEIHELIRELKKYAIKYEVEDYRVYLYGGNNDARSHYTNLIYSDSEIEAMLILEYSKKDADLRYEIEERASICWADGMPYDLLKAVKLQMEVARYNESKNQV